METATWPHKNTPYTLGNSHMTSQQHTIFLGKQPHTLTTTHHIPWERGTFPHNNTPYSLANSHIPLQQHLIFRRKQPHSLTTTLHMSYIIILFQCLWICKVARTVRVSPYTLWNKMFSFHKIQLEINTFYITQTWGTHSMKKQPAHIYIYVYAVLNDIREHCIWKYKKSVVFRMISLYYMHILSRRPPTAVPWKEIVQKWTDPIRNRPLVYFFKG